MSTASGRWGDEVGLGPGEAEDPVGEVEGGEQGDGTGDEDIVGHQGSRLLVAAVAVARVHRRLGGEAQVLRALPLVLCEDGPAQDPVEDEDAVLELVDDARARPALDQQTVRTEV
eukprot:scaffold253_cov63-Phaeocystis_antarctica.AAC.2